VIDTISHYIRSISKGLGAPPANGAQKDRRRVSGDQGEAYFSLSKSLTNSP